MDFLCLTKEKYLFLASFSLTDVKLRHEPTWKSQMTDILQHILRSLFKYIWCKISLNKLILKEKIWRNVLQSGYSRLYRSY